MRSRGRDGGGGGGVSGKGGEGARGGRKGCAGGGGEVWRANEEYAKCVLFLLRGYLMGIHG